jgi:hypothetical protein
MNKSKRMKKFKKGTDGVGKSRGGHGSLAEIEFYGKVN